jgi:hypothetical protein
VHAAFIEEDDVPKLKLSKLDATEDFVPKYIPYDRSAYAPTARARALPARTPAKYIMFNDDAPKPVNTSPTQPSENSMRELVEVQPSLAGSDVTKKTETIRRLNGSASTTLNSSHNHEEKQINDEGNEMSAPGDSICPSMDSEQLIPVDKQAKLDLNSDFLPAGTKSRHRKSMGDDKQQSLRAAVKVIKVFVLTI